MLRGWHGYKIMMDINITRRRFWFLFVVYCCSVCSCANTYSETGSCYGTSSGLSVGEDRMDHYIKMSRRYQNCTVVKGNLELTGLQDPNLNVSFLQNIEVVTGYVLIAFSYLPYLPLEKLKIIRGRELYRDKYALYVTVNYNAEDRKDGLKELRLKSLTEIARGSVKVDINKMLCFANTIHWKDILNPFARTNMNWTVETSENKDPEVCGPCDPSCKAGCWGEGPLMCQKLTLELCSPDCGYARCRGPTPEDCCDEECAVGCTGPTDKDCEVCLNVNNSGSCETSCPAAHTYDPQTQRHIPNPKFKYHYYDQCVDKCPSNLLIEGNGCVKSCRTGSHNDGSGKCVPCKDGVCDKECYGVEDLDGPLANAKSVDSLNIHYFEGCNVVKGNIVFLSFAFVGDVHKNLSAINISQLNAFRNVKVITGYLHIVAWPRELKNFSIFQNLQRIDGVDLYRDVVALVIQDNIHAQGPFYLDHITSLGFSSLNAISHGNVYIGHVHNLCYARLVNWTTILKHPKKYRGFKDGILLRNNKAIDECLLDGKALSCHPFCSSRGCVGAGPQQCVSCRQFSYNNTCFAECELEKRLYSVANETECKKCHPLCTFCTGPGPSNCTGCVHFDWNGTCVEECPIDMYPDPKARVCKLCHSNCVIHEADRMCNGPNNTLGKNGCKYCDYVITTSGFVPIQCLPRNSRCPDAHFSREGSALNAKHMCVPCYEGCSNCTGLAKEDCAHALSSPEEELMMAVIIPVLAAVFILLAIFFFCRHRRKKSIRKRQHSMRALGIDTSDMASSQKRKKRKRSYLIPIKHLHSSEEAYMDPRTRLMEPMTPSGVAPNQAQLRIVKDAELRIGKILGSGAFGTVHKGYWIPDLAPRERVKVPVAIKVLRDESSQVASNEILDEAFVMASCEHPYLVRLLGISLSQKIMLITQLMPLGNLLEYVRDNKDKIGSQHLLNWCLQISKGMRYLAEEKHLVHRDLAARNVLVKSPSHVRITDFGLAKLLDVNEDVYRAEGGKMPIKWLALESIQHRIFTQKSDVWSFGVTMWELMTFGKKPYENVHARQVHTLLERGERLPQPYICTIDIYMLLIKCWTVDAEARPTFRELSEELSKMARDPQRYVVTDNEGVLAELPSPTTSEFLRSLMNEEGDDFPITDAEEYLHPQPIDVTGDGIVSENPFALQPCPTVVPWKRQYHQQQLSSTSSQQGLLDGRGNGSGGFRNRTDSGRQGQPLRSNDRRLDSVMTTMTNLSSVSGSHPNGASTPFASVTMPMSPECEEETALVVAGRETHNRPSQPLDSFPSHLGPVNSSRTFSDSSDVFSPLTTKRTEDGQPQWTGNQCLENAQSRLTRPREDSTTLRYSAEPVSLLRQQTKPNEQQSSAKAQAETEFSKDDEGYLTPFEAANKRPEYLDPSEFPPSPFALKPPVDFSDFPTSSLSNPEYEPTFVPSDGDAPPDETGYKISNQLDLPEYQNLNPDENLNLKGALSLRHASQSGESVSSVKRDSGMQSDEESDKKATAVANPNYEYLEDANSRVVIFPESDQAEYVNVNGGRNNKSNYPEDDIFSMVTKNQNLPGSKNITGRTYSEPDSGVGIDVGVDNILYHTIRADGNA